jgi:hypothetical protein
VEFYSFSFGEMSIAQADEASPKLVAVEATIGFKAEDTQTVQVVEVRVMIPHREDLGHDEMRQAAYERVRLLLRAAADHCVEKTHAELAAASEPQLIRAGSSPS